MQTPLDEWNGDVELIEKAREYRSNLIELVVDQDDEAMLKYFDGVDPSYEQLQKCIRTGTNAGVFVPVLCGSAFKNKGVQVTKITHTFL